MEEADYAALAAHLSEVRPTFDRFCQDHGFAYVHPGSLGRYPRIRIQQTGAIERWIELWMELDAQGRRFEKFQRDLPYELSGGAHFYEPDGTKYGTRVQLARVQFSQLPFERVGAVLASEMEACLGELERWDKGHIERHGRRVLLGR